MVARRDDCICGLSRDIIVDQNCKFKKTSVSDHQAFDTLNLVGGGGGSSAYESGGMLVVSVRGVNFGFWSHLECSGQNATIFSREGLV